MQASLHSSNSEQSQAQNELNVIFTRMKTDKSHTSIKALCSYITKNRSNTDETIKKISLFINANDDTIPVNVILKTINSVLDLLTENSQMINFLNMVLPILVHLIYYNNRTVNELDSITDTIGSLIKDRGIFIRQIIESKIEELFDKFSNDSASFKFENTKYAMIKLLSVIIYNSPTISYNKITDKSTFEIFLKVLDNFKDNKEEIRKSIGDLIGKFFIMLNNRDKKTKYEKTKNIYERINKQFVKYITDNNPPSNHHIVDGWALALSNFSLQKDFIKKKFEDIMTLILACRNSKSTQIKITILNFLPFIAQCDIDKYVKEYSHLIVKFMIELLTPKQNQDVRNALFYSFGQFSKFLPKTDNFISLYNKVIDVISQCFEKDIIDLSILECLSNILKYYREEVKARININEILSKMFKIGFSQSHMHLIQQILYSYGENTQEHIKTLVSVLNVISVIICDSNFVLFDSKRFLNEPSCPFNLESEKDSLNVIKKCIENYIKDNASNPNTNSGSKDTVKDLLASNPQKEILIANAMCFLKEINHRYFTKDILVFYHQKCLFYLSMSNYVNGSIVKEKCIELAFANWVRIFKDDVTYTKYILSNILDAYINVVINDSDDEIKYKMLNYIDERFYFLLEEGNFFRKLVSILSIPDSEIWRLVLRIIGQMAKHNPRNNYVILYIQKSIIETLDAIQQTDNVMRKESLVLLSYYYVLNAKEFFNKEGIDKIYKTLLDIIDKYVNNTVLNINVLRIIGELVKEDNDNVNYDNNNQSYQQPMNQSASEYSSYLNIFLNVCLNNLKEGLNTSKLQVSLQTMYEIIKKEKIDLYKRINPKNEKDTNTKVIVPYLEFVSILIQILIRDTTDLSRKYVLDIFGLCGAMDPEQLEKLYNSSTMASGSKIKKLSPYNTDSSADSAEPLSSSNDVDPCTQQAVISLMRILKDNSQQELSTQIIACLGGLIKSLQPSDSPLIDIILPTVIEMIPQFEQSYAKSMFENMIIILRNFKEKFLCYIHQFINIIKIYLMKPNYHDIVFQVLQKVLAEFDLENYYHIFIPIFIKLIKEKSKETKNIIICFSRMANKLSTYLNIIIPEILLLYQENKNEKICVCILQFIEKIILLEDIIYYLPRIIQSLLNKVISDKRYADKTLDIFIKINLYLRNEFIGYLPLIIRIYKHISSTNYLAKLQNLINNPNPIAELQQQLCSFKCIMGTNSKRDSNSTAVVSTSISNTSMKDNSGNSAGSGDFQMINNPQMGVNNTSMKNRKTQTDKELIVKVFETQHCSVEDDWREWFKTTSKILFEQSPSYALFYCHMVADYYFPLIIELYNYGFISVWRNFNDYHKMSVINNLICALDNPKTPNDILLTILNLAEFIEREENQMDFIDFAKLGEVALKCKAYAKALYYKECDFRNKNDHGTFEQLISLYYELKLPESAIGILKLAEKNNKVVNEDNWYIKLHQWKEGLKVAERRLQTKGEDIEHVKMKIACLDGLGDWETLLDMDSKSDNESMLILAKASLNLSKWDKLKEYTNLIAIDNDDTKYQINFYNAVISIQEDKYNEAKKFIIEAKSEIDSKIKLLVSESYARGYELLLKNEIMYQLEEIISYKQNKITKEDMVNTWDRRLQYINKDPSIFERALAIRSLVLNINEDYENYLELAKICRKNNQFDTCFKVLERIRKKLNPSEKNNEIIIKIELSKNKCLFEEGNENEAITNANKIISEYNISDISDKIKSKVYGSYAYFSIKNLALNPENEESLKSILKYLELSTKYNSKNYKSWHSYALLNYQFFEILSNMNNGNYLTYALNAVIGFTNSICIGGKNISKILQDLLRLLDLWFTIGSIGELQKHLSNSFEVIDIDSFLLVIPQLLARIDINDKVIFEMLHNLLLKIGNAHPRALIYPLIVMNKSRSKKRRIATGMILNEMDKEHLELIKECSMFIDEFNRCAMLLHEEWYDAIEEGAKMFFNQNDINGMIKILLQVHEKMNRPAETMNEVHFYQLFSSELAEAEMNIRSYLETHNEIELKQAWEIYHSVYKSIGEHYNNFKVIDLENVSPRLYNFKQSQICVPGIYLSSNNLIRISHIGNTLSVFSTKQHPRKISIYGTNDKEYMYLLKGHEDLRQDERAMQLFNLVNTLLGNERSTAHKNLFIKCFSVIPLSHNTGIIGWVPNCDTLHQLIKEYRTNNKIIQNAEHRLMYSLYPKFESSTFLNKVEIFKNALQNTLGLEIYKILWTKSKNSEAWLERRTNYSRSLAVMSMVGYILGLGDRHPSNLMLDRKTGKIIHIDFGDCFEVAMKRDKFPERVPFRLTRMLIKALEVSGIEGTFRITCENVMKILRDNKDSLLAILASFVHDPLISFRLMIPMIMKKNRNIQREKEKSSKNIKPVTKQNDNSNEQSSKFRISQNLNNINEQGEIMDDTYERKKMQSDERQIFTTFEERDEIESEELNKIAKIVLDRINDKLQGTDFQKGVVLDVKNQVERLICQATSHENLAQSYLGWCPFW